MTAVIARLRSVWNSTRGSGLAPGGEDGPRSNLFQCPSCGTVYVAAEKQACSDCDRSVEQVRSTLADH